MNPFRRWLASGALILTVLQVGLLYMAPVSACCDPDAAANAAQSLAGSDDAPDCCPPGAHRAGECPLHTRASKADARGSITRTHCRMTCNRTPALKFVLGAIGLLPSPSAIVVSLAPSAMSIAASAPLAVRPPVPDPPPPRLL